MSEEQLNKDDHSGVEITFSLNGNAFKRLIQAIKADPLLWEEVKGDLITALREAETRLTEK